MARDSDLFRQLGGSQRLPNKQGASIFDDAPGRAECGLCYDVTMLCSLISKFGPPVLIESKASRVMQPPQAPSP